MDAGLRPPFPRSLLFEEERRPRLDPLVGVRAARQADVRDHLQPLGAGVQRQPDVVVGPGDGGGGGGGVLRARKRT